MTMQPLSSDLVLPWSPDKAQEERFVKWTRNTGIALLLLFVIVPWLPVFEAEYVPEERKIVKTKVVLEAVKPPPAPKPKVEPKPKPKPEVKPKPKPKTKPKPPKAKTKQPGNKPKAKAKPVDTKAALRKSAGLAEVQSELSALRGALNVAGMKRKKASNKKGVVATANRNTLGENRATKASLGVSIDESSMKGDTVKLASHATTEVSGVVSVGGSPDGVRGHSSYRSGQRDTESIRMKIELKKPSIYALYHAALDENPDLKGKFIFKLIIEPDGSVSSLALVSSELGLQPLETKILNQIRRISFGSEDVSATPVEYKFVFFPS
ncbi:AgmX/PglI C-terminal domain-containing protein [Pleionea sp. CnH1-48]|uniref:AgmX/PglI C-terminal domain-containing protein n=1 Tax=Pleionea sp. CnH1-48 TaxID=2954494 RepID=UPI002098475D|nr:AgmX/PglI C-terminal domain-containing protein [Pleionea sp. CnH1-48]